jgi:hypothetical protein
VAKNGDDGGCGCLGFIAFLIVLWALVFGVTIDGKHYGLSCSVAQGVEIQWGDPETAEAPADAPVDVPAETPAESPK